MSWLQSASFVPVTVSSVHLAAAVDEAGVVIIVIYCSFFLDMCWVLVSSEVTLQERKEGVG